MARYPRQLAIWAALVLFPPAFAVAQTAVVTRNVHLRSNHNSSSTDKGLLTPPTEMTLIVPNATSGFYHVQLPSGAKGWVWGNNIRIDTADAPAAADTPPTGGPPEVYRNCDLDGDAKTAHYKALNVLKNRVTAPAAADIDPAVTIAAVLAPENETKWKEDRGASIVAYVAHVKSGGPETVNCTDNEQQYLDTHIELVANVADAGNKHLMIVEVTPRWREFVADQGKDWSTPTLETALTHHWVRFTGWMFNDSQHAADADNTNPGDPNNWRGSSWEIHPVTDIKVCSSNSPAGC